MLTILAIFNLLEKFPFSSDTLTIIDMSTTISAMISFIILEIPSTPLLVLHFSRVAMVLISCGCYNKAVGILYLLNSQKYTHFHLEFLGVQDLDQY